MSSQVVAVDLGGTKTAIALVNQSLTITNLKTIPTPKEKEELLSTLVKEIKLFKDYQGVGVAVAGAVDAAGQIVASPNIPLADINLKSFLEKQLKTKVAVDNDANLAALGEKLKGTARQFNNFILLTLGTGIGGGIFVNGQLYRGSYGAAGEIGHMVLQADGPQCSCGRLGCFEALASGTALEREGHLLVKTNPNSFLAAAVQKNEQKLDGKLLAKVALQGDKDTIALWQKVGYFLGLGIGSLINIFNPEAIVLSGGLMDAQELFLKKAKEVTARTVIDKRTQSTPIIKGELGEKAGLIGAAALAF